MQLLWRVTLINAAVLAVGAAVLALSPATVSAPVRAGEAVGLAVGVVVLLLVDVLLLRRALAPVAELAEMRERLERERRASGRRALDAQERERRRLGRELHDELGQTLTGLALLTQALANEVPAAQRPAVERVQEAARAAIEKTRELARGLRPQALEEFGLRSALIALAAGVAERGHLRVHHELAADLPPIPPEHELAIYRTAQESLTNVVRHAEATAAVITLASVDHHVVLTVRDDGRGVTREALHDAGGVGGMRERALLVGGRFSIERGPHGGTEVRLELPLGGRR